MQNSYHKTDNNNQERQNYDLQREIAEKEQTNSHCKETYQSDTAAHVQVELFQLK